MKPLQVASAVSRAEQRRTLRHEVSFTAAVHRARPQRLMVHVVDVSLNGVMARTSAGFAPGEQVAIDLPHAGKREATIRWALGGRIGCEFITPLPEAVCRRIVAEPPPPPSPWLRF